MYGFISIFPTDDKILRGSFFHYSTILLLEQNIFFVLYQKIFWGFALSVKEEGEIKCRKKFWPADLLWRQMVFGDWRWRILKVFEGMIIL